MRHLVAVTIAATHPPRRGGQVRTASLLANLGEAWSVASYSLAFQRSDLPFPRRDHPVTKRWTDHRTRDPFTTAWYAARGRSGRPPLNVERVLWAWPHRALVRSLASADVVMVELPYQYRWVRRHTPPSVPIVVDEHDIETQLHANTSDPQQLEAVTRCEREALGDAGLVFVTSDADADAARALGASRVVVVRNGVDLRRFRPVATEERVELRRRLGLSPNRTVALFCGSAHPPNVEAVVDIERSADAYAASGIDVVVVGRCGAGRRSRIGVSYLGEVPDTLPYLQAADIALSPLRSGAGTSLKVVEYLAAGLPVVATEMGVRGLGLRPGIEVELTAADDTPATVAALAGDPDRTARLAAAGRAVAKQRFGWDSIGRTAAAALETLTTSPDGSRRREMPAPRIP